MPLPGAPAPKRAVAVRHVPFEDLGSWAGVLGAAGFRIRYLDAGRDDLSRLDPLSPDLLIVLGGPIGARDDADYPFLAVERGLLARRLAADRPTLGICLGCQLMAAALGARVYAAPGPELGWQPIRLTAPGRQSCLAALGDGVTPVLHWHGDTFDLPADATLLASTRLCPAQAFRYGRRALGLQFHAEVTPAGLEQWYIGHTLEIAAHPSLSVGMLRQAARRCGPALAAPARKLLECWLGEVGLAPTTPHNPPASR